MSSTEQACRLLESTDTLGLDDVDHDRIIERIRAIADAKGRQRFVALAERYELPLGEYDGRPCALVADVALVFGVTPQAVRKALVNIRERLPDAAVECNPAEVQGSNLKLRPAVTRIVVIFWRGFLALSQSGRGPAAKEVRDFLEECETQERLATATAMVTAEEADRRVRSAESAALAKWDTRFDAMLATMQATAQAVTTLAERLVQPAGPAALPARPAAPYTLPPRRVRAPRAVQRELALVPPPDAGPVVAEREARARAAAFAGARRAAGVLQKTLAPLVARVAGHHVSRSSLSDWETGRSAPSAGDWKAWRKSLAEFPAAARFLASAAA